VTVRGIAPSPTGNLHIGTARTAVFNWLFARHHGVILSYGLKTPSDRALNIPKNILDGLWLGLNWDEGTDPSAWIYTSKAIQTLLEKGLAYRCYSTKLNWRKCVSQKVRGEAPCCDNRHRNRRRINRLLLKQKDAVS